MASSLSLGGIVNIPSSLKNSHICVSLINGFNDATAKLIGSNDGGLTWNEYGDPLVSDGLNNALIQCGLNRLVIADTGSASEVQLSYKKGVCPDDSCCKEKKTCTYNSIGTETTLTTIDPTSLISSGVTALAQGDGKCLLLSALLDGNHTLEADGTTICSSNPYGGATKVTLCSNEPIDWSLDLSNFNGDALNGNDFIEFVTTPDAPPSGGTLVGNNWSDGGSSTPSTVTFSSTNKVELILHSSLIDASVVANGKCKTTITNLLNTNKGKIDISVSNYSLYEKVCSPATPPDPATCTLIKYYCLTGGAGTTTTTPSGDVKLVDFQHTAGATTPDSTENGITAAASLGGSFTGSPVPTIDEMSAALGNGSYPTNSFPNNVSPDDSTDYYFSYLITGEAELKSLDIRPLRKDIDRRYRISYIIGGVETFLTPTPQVAGSILDTLVVSPVLNFPLPNIPLNGAIEFRVYWAGSADSSKVNRVYVDNFCINGCYDIVTITPDTPVVCEEKDGLKCGGSYFELDGTTPITFSDTVLLEKPKQIVSPQSGKIQGGAGVFLNIPESRYFSLSIIDSDGTAQDDLGGSTQYVSDSPSFAIAECVNSDFPELLNGDCYEDRSIPVPEGVCIHYQFLPA